MDTRNVIQILDVRRGLQNFTFDPEPAMLTKVPELGAVADRILEVEVGRSRFDSREVARSRDAGETIREISPNISRHIPFSPCWNRDRGQDCQEEETEEEPLVSGPQVHHAVLHERGLGIFYYEVLAKCEKAGKEIAWIKEN